jgi:hypothetical protein
VLGFRTTRPDPVEYFPVLQRLQNAEAPATTKLRAILVHVSSWDFKNVISRHIKCSVKE